MLLSPQETREVGTQIATVEKEIARDEWVEQFRNYLIAEKDASALTLRNYLHALREFHQQAASGHVLELARRVAPVPLCCQLPREPPPAPVRVRYDQLANLREVGWAQRSTLHQDGLLSLAHEPSMAKEKTGVQ